MESTMEKIEEIKDRIEVTYGEAKEALEESSGSVLDAIIYLEEKDKKKSKNKPKSDNSDFIRKEKRKLTFLLDNIIEDPSIPQKKKTEMIIHSTSLLCAIVAVQPIPFADLF
jgi:hypothetical protein